MLRLYIDKSGRGVCTYDTDSIMPAPTTTARFVELDGRVNPQMLPRIVVAPVRYIVTRYGSAFDFDIALDDEPTTPQAVIDRRAEIEAMRNA